MRAHDLMSQPAVTVRATTPVKEAISLLSRHGFTALPVVDQDERLIGIVTEADLVRDRVLVDPRAWIWHTHTSIPSTVEDQLVGAVLTTKVVSVERGADIADVAGTMLRQHLRSLPVVDGDMVIGVITRQDVLRVRATPDTVIAHDVRRRLANYGNDTRWTVEVHNGAVSIVDATNDSTDRHVALVIAQAVPGVQSVVVNSRMDTPA